jgi:hypothetical protein
MGDGYGDPQRTKMMFERDEYESNPFGSKSTERVISR